MDAVAIGLGLILVNGFLLLVAGLVTFENPFRVGVLASVLLANVGVFFIAVLVTSDSPGSALFSLTAKLLPFAVIALGVAGLLLVQVGIPNRGRR